MIIDSKQYNGPCLCGRTHHMTTECCIIEAGCMSNLQAYLQQYGLTGYSVAVYDENTYQAKGLIRPAANQEIILSPDHLHADEHGVALVQEKLPDRCDYLIAIGSGTIHDITRYCAYQKGIPFVSCPTAASVDGFCSSVAAMTWYGYKKTLTAVAPKIVVADLNVISQAPLFLARSGFGDMAGKYIALADWKLGHLLTGEYFCPSIYDMTRNAAQAIMKCAKDLPSGHLEVYEKLLYGLLISGLAMQLLGNSRCASGAEHHISHLIEMQPEGLGVHSHALHGEKVGVGTLLACQEYHRLLQDPDCRWKDYPKIQEDAIKAMFGDALSDSIQKENETDAAAGITASQIEKNWDGICHIIGEIPEYEELLKLYQTVGAKSSLNEIQIPEEKRNLLLDYSPMVRNRLTFMRLRSARMKDETF